MTKLPIYLALYSATNKPIQVALVTSESYARAEPGTVEPDWPCVSFGSSKIVKCSLAHPMIDRVTVLLDEDTSRPK